MYQNKRWLGQWSRSCANSRLSKEKEKALIAAQDTHDVNEYHRQLGHPNEQITSATAKVFGIKLSGKFQKCKDCAIAKARQKMQRRFQAKRSNTLADVSVWTYLHLNTRVFQASATGSYFGQAVSY